MPTIVKDYRTWAEWLATIDALPQGATTGRDRSWSGSALSIGAACALAHNGWKEGSERIRSITLPVVTAMSGSLEHDGLGMDVTGASFDVGAHLTGTPECWLTLTSREVRPAITIAANITSSGGISSEHLEMRGAAVVALALALQASGYAVRVHAICGMAVSKASENTVWQRIALTDDEGGPIDTDRLLFALAHPASSRQLMYGNGEVLQGFDLHEWHTLPWPEGGVDARPPAEWGSDLYLHAVHMRDAAWASAESVAAWVQSQYDTLTKGGDRQAE